MQLPPNLPAGSVNWRTALGGGLALLAPSIAALVGGVPVQVALPYTIVLALIVIDVAVARELWSRWTDGTLLHSREHKEYKALADTRIATQEMEIARLRARIDTLLGVAESSADTAVQAVQFVAHGREEARRDAAPAAPATLPAPTVEGRADG